MVGDMWLSRDVEFLLIRVRTIFLTSLQMNAENRVLLNTAKDDKGPQIDVLNTAKYDKGPQIDVLNTAKYDKGP